MRHSPSLGSAPFSSTVDDTVDHTYESDFKYGAGATTPKGANVADVLGDAKKLVDSAGRLLANVNGIVRADLGALASNRVVNATAQNAIDGVVSNGLSASAMEEIQKLVRPIVNITARLGAPGPAPAPAGPETFPLLLGSYAATVTLIFLEQISINSASITIL